MATEIRSLIDEGAARLARVSDEPRREAEVLLGEALGRPRAWLLAHPEERILDCEATDRYEALVTRRALGEPVAYLLGEKEFWSLSLAIGPGVLIPRPETERLVECALAHLPADRSCDVLDLATGSGAVALAIAAERPHARVLATDLSEAAVDTARTNAARLGLGQRVAVHAGAWYEPVAGRRFDVIVSNPPYIAAADPRVAPAVRRYEPPQALFAGADGLEALRAVVGGAPGHLVPGGWLLVEHGDTQGAAVRELLEAGGFEQVQTHRDLAGRERCTEGCRPGRESSSVFGDSIAGPSRSRSRILGVQPATGYPRCPYLKPSSPCSATSKSTPPRPTRPRRRRRCSSHAACRSAPARCRRLPRDGSSPNSTACSRRRPTRRR